MILLNIKRIINEYVECDLFEIKIVNKKIKIYYYDKVSSVSSNKITIIKDDDIYTITGKNLVIETMFKEQIVISGNVKNIQLGINYE